MGIREGGVTREWGDSGSKDPAEVGLRAGIGVPIRFWLWFAGFWFIPGLAFRLYVAYGLNEESAGDRVVAVLTGMVSDLQALALVFAFLGLGFLVGARFARWWLGFTLASVAVVFIADCTYWLEFQSRFDRFVLHYAQYPREVLVFLDEQFFLGLFGVPFAILVWLVTRWISRWLPERMTGLDRAVCCLWILVGVGVAATASPGVAGHSRHLHHLSSNGYLGILMAMGVDESVWDGFYWRPDPEDPDVAVALAAPAALAGERGPGARPAEPASAGEAAVEAVVATADDRGSRPAIARPETFRHVVMIIEESLGGEFWRDAEKRARYMPRLKALAEGGLSFESVYATGGFTIRGLEAMLNGYPPLPGVVVTTEPRLERLPSLPRELGRAGFRTVFVYGGWPGFTSFHDYWRRIGYHEMLDRYDFDDRWFETSWGVADEILFERVLEEMDRLAAKFDRVMLTTLTVSNHRPFDFPDGRIDYPSDERRREYVIAYADWALGEFFDAAERRPWFDDTLFVVAVDHGPVHAGRALVPAQGFRVPLVFYSPGKLPPAVIGHQGSIMSLAVTLFELLGIAPEESFYGRSLLKGDGPVPVELHHEVGMLGSDRMTVLVRGGGLLGWRYDGEKLTPDEPDILQAVQADALFRGAHERLYGVP